MKKTRFFVVFASGHGGARSTVLSAHYTYRAALKAIRDTTMLCIRVGHKRKGDDWYAFYADVCEQETGLLIYPYATGEIES